MYIYISVVTHRIFTCHLRLSRKTKLGRMASKVCIRLSGAVKSKIRKYKRMLAGEFELTTPPNLICTHFQNAVYMYIHIYTIQICTRMRTDTCIHSHKHAYIHTYTHTHARARNQRAWYSLGNISQSCLSFTTPIAFHPCIHTYT